MTKASDILNKLNYNPPRYLYHYTSEENIASIRKTGLRPYSNHRPIYTSSQIPQHYGLTPDEVSRGVVKPEIHYFKIDTEHPSLANHQWREQKGNMMFPGSVITTKNDIPSEALEYHKVSK